LGSAQYKRLCGKNVGERNGRQIIGGGEKRKNPKMGREREAPKKKNRKGEVNETWAGVRETFEDGGGEQTGGEGAEREKEKAIRARKNQREKC